MLLGKIYSDPEGEWLVTEVDRYVTVRNIQEGNLNYGQECYVTKEEAEYYINGCCE